MAKKHRSKGGPREGAPAPETTKADMRDGLTRKQREERKLLRRSLLIGSAALVTASAGTIFWSARPAHFDSLSGADTLSERLGRITDGSHAHILTGSEGDLDIVVVGDTGCQFCVDFVQGGLDDLVEFANDHDLSVAYVSTGFTDSGLTTTLAASCLEKVPSRLDPVDRVRALYDFADNSWSGMTVLESLLEGARDLGINPSSMDSCAGDQAAYAATRSRDVASLFKVESTPSFLVSDPESGRISRINGYNSASGMLRQIRRARGMDT